MLSAWKIFSIFSTFGGTAGLVPVFQSAKSSGTTNLTEKSLMTMNLYNERDVWVCLVNKENLQKNKAQKNKTLYYELLFWYAKKSNSGDNKEGDCQKRTENNSKLPKWYWRVEVLEQRMEELIQQTVSEKGSEYQTLQENLKNSKQKLQKRDKLDESEQTAISTLITLLHKNKDDNWTWISNN